MTSTPILLITGANTGLGFETVMALCQSSKAFTILLGGRDLSKANAAVEKAQKKFPTSPSSLNAVQIDIEDDDSISQLFDHVSTTYGRLDILINNAGNTCSTTSHRLVKGP
jgi:NAD(P)-dependent dehydrogenase (short-subunit alcohol dehydrogenase family)